MAKQKLGVDFNYGHSIKAIGKIKDEASEEGVTNVDMMVEYPEGLSFKGKGFFDLDIQERIDSNRSLYGLCVVPSNKTFRKSFRVVHESLL